MKRVIAWCLALVPVAGMAAPPEPASTISNDDLLAYLGNMRIEARLDVDVTGDGRLDVVYVAGNVHERVLGVISGGERTTQLGRRVVGAGVLDGEPQAPPALGFDRGVLTVEDLTGTDMVTLARYQYRYQPSPSRMRLSALVCEQYSPTLSRSSLRLSWNLDHGDHVIEHGHVVRLDSGEDVYIYETQSRTSRKAGAVYMEAAPHPDELLATQARVGQQVAADADKQRLQSP